MTLADIVVALIGFGMMIVVVACGVAAFAVVREVWEDYRGLLAQARKHPRFGIGAMFTLLTIAAAACALFRWAGDANLPVVTAVVAISALVFAVGIVCAIQFVIGDFYDNWSRRQARSRREVIWQEAKRLEADDTSKFPDRV